MTIQTAPTNIIIIAINAVLKSRGLQRDEEMYIGNFTNGRKKATSELTRKEAVCLAGLLWLNDAESYNKAILSQVKINENRAAKQATDKLLKELNITVK